MTFTVTPFSAPTAGQNSYLSLLSHGIYRLFSTSEIIPTRSLQENIKQFCLWDLAQIIGILFIIQIVETI